MVGPAAAEYETVIGAPVMEHQQQMQDFYYSFKQQQVYWAW